MAAKPGKNHILFIDHNGVRNILESEEMYQDVEEIANALIGDRRFKSGTKRRYTVERSRGSKRAVANVMDKNKDAIAYEMETGTLQRLSRRKI